MLSDADAQPTCVQNAMSTIERPCPYDLEAGAPDIWTPPGALPQQTVVLYAAFCKADIDLQADVSPDVLRAFKSAASLWDRLARSSSCLSATAEPELTHDVKVCLSMAPIQALFSAGVMKIEVIAAAESEASGHIQFNRKAAKAAADLCDGCYDRLAIL